MMGRTFVFYRPLYVIFSFASLIAVFIFLVEMKDFQLFSLTNVIFISGVLVCFSGLVMMIVCIQKYFISLSGIRRLVHPGETPVLMITGIHRYVRHPLYAGTFLFIWGLFIFMPYSSLLISSFIITVYTLIGIRFEEEKLVKEFGLSYLEYKNRVPKIIPSFKPLPAS